jgi:hypothetical protein
MRGYFEGEAPGAVFVALAAVFEVTISELTALEVTALAASSVTDIAGIFDDSLDSVIVGSFQGSLRLWCGKAGMRNAASTAIAG